LRFFGGLDMQEIAGVLDISERTARRDWISARAWLRHEVSTDLGLSMSGDADERRED
ncbi:MAG: ECF-type sigma factor, partial [Acidobacteriota bacterium]